VVRIERLKRAKTLLKDTGKSIETVAGEIGYENVEHFNRLFKKTYGITPAQYRKS
jgi:2-isopropylmalate synthase